MEDNYGKILVAIDDSEQSYKALKEALAIARRNDSQLYILTVTDMSIAIADARIVQYMRELADEQSKKVTEKIEKHLPSDINYTIRKVEGTPKVSIVQFAKETGIDLIAMGATGKGAIERTLVGSTTSYVVSHAPCNVLVVK